uniref:CN hydrolase domain-containing protein n=1 Tax=Chenopodium quinoa TaxID=63459 RepID=A0A803M8F1_CHEQI
MANYSQIQPLTKTPNSLQNLKHNSRNLSFLSSQTIAVKFRNPNYSNITNSPFSTTISAISTAHQSRVPPALPLPPPPITKFKIALCQLSVTSDKLRNISHAREAIEEAANKGAQLVLLPIHLFDIDIPGKMTFKESKTLTAGENPTIVDTDVGRIGIGICYDIRFQELAAIYAARGAHLLCYPGAFNMTTGPLHWELLQRARIWQCTAKIYCFSVEPRARSLCKCCCRAESAGVDDVLYISLQLYVATCAPARDTESGYVAWGHSTLVGPFGEVLATTDHDETTLIAEIDYSLVEQRR